MTEIEKGQTVLQKAVSEEVVAPATSPPKGELKMLALLFIIGAAFLVEALKVDGIYQGVSDGPGTMPQMIAFLMLVLIAGKAAFLIKDGYQEGGFQETLQHLFNKDVVILLFMVILYGLVLETLHFIATSILFMSIVMYLLDRKQPVRKVLISCAVVAVLVLIFDTVFQIILP